MRLLIFAALGLLALSGIVGDSAMAQSTPPAASYTGQSESGKTWVGVVLKDAIARPDGTVTYAGTMETRKLQAGGSDSAPWPFSKAVFSNGNLRLETQDQGKLTSVTALAWDGRTLRGKQTYMPFSGPQVVWGMSLTPKP
jgi:hypothetical protein